MAHFFGEVIGKAKAASRLGTKNSGLTVTAASWAGSIRVELWYDPATGKDHYRVVQAPWHGSGVFKEIATGVIGE